PSATRVPYTTLFRSDLALLELDGDTTVGDVADVAVVQRIEMRDVEQVLDQQEIIGRDLHRADHDAVPAVVGHLGQPRRLPHLGEDRKSTRLNSSHDQ